MHVPTIQDIKHSLYRIYRIGFLQFFSDFDKTTAIATICIWITKLDKNNSPNNSKNTITLSSRLKVNFLPSIYIISSQ